MKQAPAKSFEDLLVWQRAHEMTLLVYKSTQAFPQEEVYGLTSQFRRAAVSIAANIAEGFKKSGKADKLRFFNIAQGSLEECRYYVILSRDLEYGPVEQVFDKLNEVSRMLNRYISAIKES